MILFDRFKQVKAFIFAVDGVCADGKVWVSAHGEPWSAFHHRDRYALHSAAQHYPVALVGNGYAPGSAQCLQGLNLADLLLATGDKKAVLGDWMSDRGVEAENVLCMGGDVTDLDALMVAGFGTCPADAADDVKAMAAYISPFNGGSGAVRDVIEKVMKLQGTWGVGGGSQLSAL